MIDVVQYTFRWGGETHVRLKYGRAIATKLYYAGAHENYQDLPLPVSPLEEYCGRCKAFPNEPCRGRLSEHAQFHVSRVDRFINRSNATVIFAPWWEERIPRYDYSLPVLVPRWAQRAQRDAITELTRLLT